MRLANDKKLHLIVGILISLVTMLLGVPVLVAVGLPPFEALAVSASMGAMIGTLAAGGKEAYDSAKPYKHTVDGWDAYATAAASVLTSSLVLGVGSALEYRGFLVFASG